jgi:hypothetical protein
MTHYYPPADTRAAILEAFARRGIRVVRRSEAPAASVLELDLTQLMQRE